MVRVCGIQAPHLHPHACPSHTHVHTYANPLSNTREHWTTCYLLTYLQPQAQLDEFVAEHLTDTPTVGVHIRHGNGEKGHFARYNRGDRWSNMEAAVDEVTYPQP